MVKPIASRMPAVGALMAESSAVPRHKPTRGEHGSRDGIRAVREMGCKLRDKGERLDVDNNDERRWGTNKDNNVEAPAKE